MDDIGKHELAELREVFNLVDTDGSGFIDIAELENLFFILGIDISRERTLNMLHKVGSSKKISFEDFVRVLSRDKQKSTDYVLSLKEDFFRLNNNAPRGLIHRDELKHLIVETLKQDEEKQAEGKTESKDVSELNREAAVIVSKLPADQFGFVNYDRYVDRMIPGFH